MEDQRSTSLFSTARETYTSLKTGNTGVCSTLNQNDNGKNEDYSIARVASIRSKKAAGSHFGWWWEVYATSLAVASTIAVIAVLIFVQGKPLAEWKMSIQPNSLVAIFSTIAKSALLVPIAECISQLKWTYFESPRALSQLQVFDSASRGPWGALVLLWKTKATALLASLGAFITILLLAFEPFTQQVVRVQTKTTWTNEISALSYAPAFKDYRYGHDISEKDVDPQGRLTFTLAMMAAMAGRPSLYESNRVCGTSSCTYPSHVSLSAQTKCEERKIRTTADFGCAYYIWKSIIEVNSTLEALGVSVEEQHKRRFIHLEDFKDALRDDDNLFRYGMNCTIERLDFPNLYINYEYEPATKEKNLTGEGAMHYVPFAISSHLPSRTTIFGNADVYQMNYHSYFDTDDLEPSNVTGSNFSFCTSKRYGEIGSAFYSRDNFTLGTYTCLDTGRILSDISNLDSFGEFNATLTYCGIALASAEYINTNFESETGDKISPPEQGNATAELSIFRPLRLIKSGTTANNFEHTARSDDLPDEFTIRPYPMMYLADMIENTLYSDNTRDFLLQRHTTSGTWSAVIEDIGKVVGEYIRSSGNLDARNMTGIAWAPQAFIKVEWVWLVLPLSLTVLSVGFLMLTIIQSRDKTYLYKTSILAVTLHGLEGWSAEEMRGYGEKVSEKDLVDMTQGIKAQIMSEDGESVRFVRRS